MNMWLSYLLIGVLRLLIGATPHWLGSKPSNKQRIYFANHSSHMDTLAIWGALPDKSRASTKPVAAADYWGKTKLRRYIAIKILNAVLITRNKASRASNLLQPLYDVLNHGMSIIIFPEGTRRDQAAPSVFKSGLYHLATQFPDVELIPVYLNNLNRSLPKGTFFPLPLICTVKFGPPIKRFPDETKRAFLLRARQSVMELM